MLIAGGGIDASKIGVCIAIAYACQRPQFGSRYIMEYLTHQRRLVPALATCYAMHFTLCALKVQSGLKGHHEEQSLTPKSHSMLSEDHFPFLETHVHMPALEEAAASDQLKPIS